MPLLHGNEQEETDTEADKSIYWDCLRFGDSSTQPPETVNSLD